MLTRKMNSMLRPVGHPKKAGAGAAQSEHQPEEDPAIIPTLPGISRWRDQKWPRKPTTIDQSG